MPESDEPAMNEPAFASLSSALLARKGGARPAMRPQHATLAALSGAIPEGANLEDLGWNDMGDDEPRQHPVPLQLTPAPDPHAASAEAVHDFYGEPETAEQPLTAEPTIQQPEVHRQHETLARWVEDQPAAPALSSAPAPAPTPAPAPVRRSALSSGRRAAFTLRLDADRHLRLRLAATIRGCSAQQLVTEALDRVLAEFVELDALAARMKRD